MKPTQVQHVPPRPPSTLSPISHLTSSTSSPNLTLSAAYSSSKLSTSTSHLESSHSTVLLNRDLTSWDEHMVLQFLDDHHFTKYKPFFLAHHIKGDILSELTYESLKEIGVTSVGDRARILQAVKKYTRKPKSTATSTTSVHSEKVLVHRINSIIANPPPSAPAPSVPASLGSDLAQTKGVWGSTGRLAPSTPTHDSPKHGAFTEEALFDTGSIFNSGIPDLTISIPNFKESPSFLSRQRSLRTHHPLNDVSKTKSPLQDRKVDMSPLVITPRSSSMKQPSANSPMPMNAVSMNEYQPVSSPSGSPKSPRSPSHPSSPIHQLISLGLIPAEDGRRHHPALDDQRKPKEAPAQPTKREDIMEKYDTVKANCIRVYDANEQSHVIRVAELNEAKTIRDKIFNKFNITDEQERDKYALFALDPHGPDDRMMIIDDVELIKICKSQNHPLKSRMTIRKTIEQRRRPDGEGMEGLKKAERSFNKLAKIFGQPAPVSGLPYRGTSSQNTSQTSLSTLLVPNESPPPVPPIPSNFRPLPIQTGSNILRPPSTPAVATNISPGESTTGRSKKLANFFGERPPDELIADDLENFFPSLVKKHSLKSASLLGTSAEQLAAPLSESSLLESSESINDSNIINKVQEAMMNKRLSKVATRYSVQQKLTVVDRNRLSMERTKNIRKHGVSSRDYLPFTPIEEKSPLVVQTEQNTSEFPSSSSLTNVTPDTLSVPSTPISGSLKSSSIISSALSSSIPSSRTSGPILTRPSIMTSTTTQRLASIPGTPTQPEHSGSSLASSGILTPPVRTTPFLPSSALTPSSGSSVNTLPVSSADSKQEQVAPPPPSQPAPDIPMMTSHESEAQERRKLARRTLPPILNWEQGKMIGQGAFGRVFLGLNTDTGEIMAVKQVIIGPENDVQKKKREDALRRELELLQELENDYIVRYLGYEIKDTTFNVFLEYVSGGSVASCLAKFGQFDQEITRFLTVQILLGLEYLHDRHIIHRDIKGANILIDSDGAAKISDFGISKKNEYHMAYQRVTRMSMQGSIYWMAPEVAKGKGYSAKVDVWSLGCLVLEMLTGHPPWNKVKGNIIYLLGTGRSPPIPEFLSDQAKDFIQHCFTSDPEKRPTVSDLLDHPFVDFDMTEIDFREWYESAEMAAEEARANAPSSSESDEETDSDASSDLSSAYESGYDDYKEHEPIAAEDALEAKRPMDMPDQSDTLTGGGEEEEE